VKKISLFRFILALLIVGIAVGILLATLFGDELFPETSPSEKGAMVAAEAGCFSCHGGRSAQPSLNPASTSEVASFTRVPSMFEERHSIEVLHEWIEDGISLEKAGSDAYLEASSTKLLKMPSFKDHLSPAEIDDLAAYLSLQQYSVSARSNPTSVPGEDLARRFACFTCHGELGQGGVMNPGSLKGYIPGFFGQDFRALTQNGDLQDVMEWIENGASNSFLNQGFLGFYPGRFFAERQAIKMPAYKEVLQRNEIETLALFVLTLLSQGPLSAEGLHGFRPVSVAERQDQSITEFQKTASHSDDLFRDVSAILSKNCLSCHGPDKQRSGYRLDTLESALKGGEIADFLGTAAVVPGSIEGGLLVKFVEALEEDIDNEIYPMPPDDNPRLSSAEIQILKSWIDQGARWPDSYRLTIDPK